MVWQFKERSKDLELGLYRWIIGSLLRIIRKDKIMMNGLDDYVLWKRFLILKEWKVVGSLKGSTRLSFGRSSRLSSMKEGGLNKRGLAIEQTNRKVHNGN